MTRRYNFCAGPAALPEAVLARARDELLDYQGRGLSVMEMSHRSDEFVAIAERAEADLRQLLDIPSNYKVLFLQGGASLQFAMLPMNLLGPGGCGNFIQTGIWGKKRSTRPSGSASIVMWPPVARPAAIPPCQRPSR